MNNRCHRMGRIEISYELYGMLRNNFVNVEVKENAKQTLQNIYSNIIPFDIEVRMDMDAVIVYGISDLFEEISLLEKTPLYQVILEDNKIKEVVKIDDTYRQKCSSDYSLHGTLKIKNMEE